MDLYIGRYHIGHGDGDDVGSRWYSRDDDDSYNDVPGGNDHRDNNSNSSGGRVNSDIVEIVMVIEVTTRVASWQPWQLWYRR